MTCPRIGSWLNKLWYNHIVIYSAVTGRGDESVCMQLEKRFQNLLLREKKCKVPSSKFNLFSFMQMLSIWMCVCPGVLIGNYPGRILKKNILTVVTSKRGVWGVGWEFSFYAFPYYVNFSNNIYVLVFNLKCGHLRVGLWAISILFLILFVCLNIYTYI